jgi:hypothetical protein
MAEQQDRVRDVRQRVDPDNLGDDMGAPAELTLGVGVEPDDVLRVVSELEETADGLNAAISNATSNEERVVLFADLADVMKFRRKLVRTLGVDETLWGWRFRDSALIHARRVRPAPARPREFRPRRQRVARGPRKARAPDDPDPEPEPVAVAPSGVAV